MVAADFDSDGLIDLATANEDAAAADGEDLSVMINGGEAPLDLLDMLCCGELCGPLGLTPLCLSLAGVLSMKITRRRRM